MPANDNLWSTRHCLARKMVAQLNKVSDEKKMKIVEKLLETLDPVVKALDIAYEVEEVREAGC